MDTPSLSKMRSSATTAPVISRMPAARTASTQASTMLSLGVRDSDELSVGSPLPRM